MTWRIEDPQGDEAGISERRCSVYALSSSADGVIRYVGQTVNGLDARRKEHLRHSRKYAHRHLSCWIRKLSADGNQLVIEQLEKDAIWNLSEISWISKLRQQGADLVNATNGGEGALGVEFSEGRRKQISKALSGRPKSDAHRKALSAARLGVPLKPGVAEKVSAALKGRAPSNLQALHAANKGSTRSDELRGRISSSLKGRQVTNTEILLANLEKARAMQGPVSDKTRAKQSASAKAAWAIRKEDIHVACV